MPDNFTSAREIARKFDLAEEIVKDVLEKSTRQALIQFFSNIVTVTPVLSGRLRSNWQAENKQMPVDAIESTTRDPIPEIKDEFGAYRIGTDAFFVNNLPYAFRIEFHGHSKKSPGGIITPLIPTWKPLLFAAVQINARKAGAKNV